MLSFLKLAQPCQIQKIGHIRIIAALWVFVFHYYHFISHSFFPPLESTNPLYLLIYHGYFCVYIFFLLSGYLLSKSHAKTLNLKTFFSKRVGRILPPYYLCLVIYCLLFTHKLPDITLWFAVLNTDTQIYPNPLGHFWFINRLLECYLCFPLLSALQQKTGKIGLFIAYLSCVLIGAYWVIENQITLAIYYGSFILCLSHFIFGMLVIDLPVMKKPIISASLALLVFILLLEYLHQLIWQAPLNHYGFTIIWFNMLALILSMLIRAYLYTPLCLPNFINKGLDKLAQISYEIYLYHFLVIYFFIEHADLLFANQTLNFISLLILSLFSAFFFQCLLAGFNRGILRIKRA
ncbi:MAG: acyltransferase family protein [Methyloprofundus sp.]|nr:acyltransferase family protein [Methyloprofundus sp.]